MELPQRIPQHITESKSYKIFSNHIPHEWIIRDVTERDYGIDCYIELVNNKNQITGELISVQLKAKEMGIPWTKKNTYTHYDINSGTTNYWHNFSTTVYLCFIDNYTEEVFFISVKDYIRNNYYEFLTEKLHYKIEKLDILDINNIDKFIYPHYKQKHYVQFENNVIQFISNYQANQDFINQNMGRDFHMDVEGYRYVYMQSLFNSIQFLGSYIFERNIIDNLETLIEKSTFKQLDEEFEFISEGTLTIILQELNKLIIPILLELKKLILVKQLNYWKFKHKPIYFFVKNYIDDKGNIQYY